MGKTHNNLLAVYIPLRKKITTYSTIVFWWQHLGQQPSKDKHRVLMLIREIKEMEEERKGKEKKKRHMHQHTGKKKKKKGLCK